MSTLLCRCDTVISVFEPFRMKYLWNSAVFALVTSICSYPTFAQQSAFWSFDSTEDGYGKFTEEVTVRTWETSPVLFHRGTNAVTDGGAVLFKGGDGLIWTGSGGNSLPGHCLGWSGGSKRNSFDINLDMSGKRALQIRMDIRSYASGNEPGVSLFEGLEYNKGDGFVSAEVDMPPIVTGTGYFEWLLNLSDLTDIEECSSVTLRWIIPDIPQGTSLRIDNLEITAERSDAPLQEKKEDLEWIDLPESKNLLKKASGMSWKTAGENAEQASFTWLEGDSSGKERLRLKTTGPRQLKSWAIRVETSIDGVVKKDDLLYLRFRIRCLDTRDETGRGNLDATVQLTEAPYTKEISGPYAADNEWSTYAVWARASRDYSAGELDLNFRLGGFAAQEMEIEDLGLYHLPPSQDEKLLPVTPPPTYEGRSSNARWRKAAAERIENFRKQNLSVTVLDQDGCPLPGIPVVIEQIRHQYGFGTAVSLWEITRPKSNENAENYRRILKSSFDAAGPENDLKWHNWIKDRENTIAGLKWLCLQGFDVRGHVLLWPSWNRVPSFLRTLESDPSRLRATILQHAEEVMGATKSYLSAWDVVNEPMFNHEILDVLGGTPFMVEIFQHARQIAPDTVLYLNEAVTLSDNLLLRNFIDIVKSLQELDAPFDGIGIQCHYSAWTLTPPEEIISTLDTLGDLGKTIAVTEFDIDTLDEALQADYLRDFYTAVFSHPATHGIQMWGFWEGQHWKPAAALWRRDWSPKPAAATYLNLVRNEWWTSETAETDARGTWSLRAFKGYHRISIYAEGQNLTREIELADEPVEVHFTLQTP